MKDLKKRILITSALPYANGPIHIGHVVEYIQTDIYVRFLKLRGYNAIYCCADDTHGTPIEINAAKEGVTPEVFIARWYKEHQEDIRLYHIGFDSFYTTHSNENRYYTELIFKRLLEGGHIYTKEIDLTYCEHCQRYLPDRYVKGSCPKCGAEDQYGDVCEKCNATYSTIDLIDPYCSICGTPPVRKGSKHYFFKLNNFSEWLKNWLTNNGNLQDEIRNQILNWVHEGLEDWCISRDGPYFGFKIPGEENKYFYVWLDAPIGYIASTSNYCKNKEFGTDEIWQNHDASIIHFIGKDIIYFHLLFWPAVLHGARFHVPDNVVVHGFLTVNGEKMSKSRGTFLTAKEFAEYVDPELLRYFYATNLSHTMTDIDLDLKNVQDRINNELVSNIANLVYRTLSFTNKNFNSKLSTPLNTELLDYIRKRANKVSEFFYNYNYRDAVREILEISSVGNKYFQDNKPWELIKTDPVKAGKVLTDCANIVKTVTLLTKPILPEFASKVEEQLKIEPLVWSDLDKVLLNHTIGTSQIILRKIDPIIINKRDKPESSQPSSRKNPSILNLKVAKVIEVEDHPKAEKLYIIKIDLGSEKRQICAGLKPYYPKKGDLLGKHLVVVTNLKPAKLRGELSEGMLLAADNGTDVGILTANNSSPGTQVLAEGIKDYNSDEITVQELGNLSLEARSNKAYVEGKLLKTTYEVVTVEKISDGKIR